MTWTAQNLLGIIESCALIAYRLDWELCSHIGQSNPWHISALSGALCSQNMELIHFIKVITEDVYITLVQETTAL